MTLQNASIWLAYGRSWCVEPEDGFEKALEAWGKSNLHEEHPTFEDFSHWVEVPAQQGPLFFRLRPEERALLLLIQSGSATYSQAALMLGLHPNEIGKKLWAARFALIQMMVQDLSPYMFRARVGKNCPEFDPQNPWMQKLFDDEMGRTDRVRIQNHSMSCDSCQALLEQMRKIYYSCAKWVPDVRGSVELFTAQMRQNQQGKQFLQDEFINLKSRKRERHARQADRLQKLGRWLAILAGIFFVFYAFRQMGL